MITPRYKGPEVDPHVAWTKVKTSAMKRPYLDCGCRNDGRDTFLHLGCARIACKTHADDPHECQHYEPESPPREGSPEVSEAFAALRSAGRVTGEQVRQIDQALGRPDWAEVDEVLRNTAYPRGACCDLHGSNCEQGGEECCDDCTERLHFADNHGGLECSAPVFAVDVSRDGTSTVAMYDGTRYTVIDETHHVTQQQLEAAVRVATTAEARRIHERAFRRESLGEWPQDQPQRRPAAGSDLDRSTEVNPESSRRPWWRIW